MVIKRPFRKKADGMRVNPRTEEEVAKGKVPKDRLIRRDPKTKGKDRPEFTPEEVFAHIPKTETETETEPKTEPASEKVAVVAKKPRKPLDPDWARRAWIKVCMNRGMSRDEAEADWDSAFTDDDW